VGAATLVLMAMLATPLARLPELTSVSQAARAYFGQLEDDLEDLVAVVRKTSPYQPLTLLGHSAGGGFALRIASSPIQNLFARTVLLAPYLGHDALTYSHRLMRNFATRGYGSDFAAVTKPLTLISGADDELMLADKYADAVAASVEVKLIDGISHMAIVSDPRAVSAIAEDVAKGGRNHDPH
jgi:alpha-beta hydrolase superfamily lysophospholipase